MRIKPIPTKGTSETGREKGGSNAQRGSSTFIVSSRHQLYQHLLRHQSFIETMTSINSIGGSPKQGTVPTPAVKSSKEAKKCVASTDNRLNNVLKIEVNSKKVNKSQAEHHSPTGSEIKVKDESELVKLKTGDVAVVKAIKLDSNVKSVPNKNASKVLEDLSPCKILKNDTPVAKHTTKNSKQTVDGTKTNMGKNKTKCTNAMTSCSDNVKKVIAKVSSENSKIYPKIIEKLSLKKEPKDKPVKSKAKPATAAEKSKLKSNTMKDLVKATTMPKIKNVTVKKEKKIKNEPKHQLSANYNKNRRVHRMASLNALAKVHILYENESRGSPSDGSETENYPTDSLTDASMDVTVNSCTESISSRKRSNSETSSSTAKTICLKTEKSQDFVPKMKKSKKEDSGSSSCSSGSESRSESIKPKLKKLLPSPKASPPPTKSNKGKKKELVPKKLRKRKAVSDVEIIDTKTCKRLACLNAQAILAASYSPERSRKVSKSLASCKLDEITTFNQKEIMTYNHEIVTDQSITTQVTNHQTCTTFIRQKQQQKPSATSTTLAKQSTTSLHNVIQKSTAGSSAANRAIEEATRIGTVKSDPGIIPISTAEETKATQQHVCKVRTLCATSQDASDRIDSEAISKVGVTAEYTEVTKVHINTTKEMQLKEELGKAAKRRRTITDKGDVAITRMYRYQTKGTSQSYCVKMHTTYKPGTTNKTLVPETQTPIAHQNKTGPIVDGVVHPEAHQSNYYNYNPHHTVVPSGQNFSLSNHPHNTSVGRVNGVPVVSVSPMVRHYGGSAFSVPHYGTNPAPPPHSQHTSLPYNQMDYSPSHDPQCLIHKPVPYHPQQSPTHQPQMHSQSPGNQIGPLHPPHAHQVSSSPSCIPPNLPHPPPAHSSYTPQPPSTPQESYLINPCLDRISPYPTQAAMSPHHHQVHPCQPLAEGGHSPSQRAPSAHQYHYHTHQRSPVRINPPVSYSPSSLNMSNSTNVSPSPVYHCQNRNVQQQRCIYSPPLSNFGSGGSNQVPPQQQQQQQEYSSGPTYTVLSPVPMGPSQTPQQRLISQQVKNLVGGSRNAKAIPKSEPITPPEVITLDSPDGFSAILNDSYYNQPSYPTDMSLEKCKRVSESPVIVREIGNINPPPILNTTTNPVKLATSVTPSRERGSVRQNVPREQVKNVNKEGPAWNLRTPNQAQISPPADHQNVPSVDSEIKNGSQSVNRATNPAEKNHSREIGRRLRANTAESTPQSIRPNTNHRRKASDSDALAATSAGPVAPAKKIPQVEKKVSPKNNSVKEKSTNEDDSSSDITILSVSSCVQARLAKKIKRNESSERRNGSGERPEIIKCEDRDEENKSVELLVSPFNTMIVKKKLGPKKFSNGWSWEGDSFDKLVYFSNDDPPLLRRCYPAMRHIEGDLVKIRDCVLLKSGPRKIDLPFVAKVAALWETPEDGEMMVSLLWYYRPEHTDQGRRPADLEDEIFASKHRDVNSVACIEDKCYVLTFAEYCRYRRRLRMFEENYHPTTSAVVPQPGDGYSRSVRLPPGRVSPEMVFVCRKVYDFRQKRLLKNPV